MARYFLDTHIAYWLISDSPKLDPNLRDNILYSSGKYITSEFVLLELIHLNQLGKIKLPGGIKTLLESFGSMNIEIDLIPEKAFEELERIPILTINKDRHTDMIDRVIIAHCIASKYTVISHDAKFPHYRKFGLELLEA